LPPSEPDVISQRLTPNIRFLKSLEKAEHSRVTALIFSSKPQGLNKRHQQRAIRLESPWPEGMPAGRASKASGCEKGSYPAETED